MSLSTRLADYVDDGVRERGREYYQSGAVSLYGGDAHSVGAIVRGSTEYYVALNRKKNVLHVSCDCPYYADGRGPCKHIWAALLAAEARGYLNAQQAPPNLWLEEDEPHSPDEAEGFEDDYDDDPDDFGYVPVQYLPPPPRAAQPKKTPTRPRPESWKKQLTQLRHGMQQQPIVHGRSSWSSGRQLLYVIDVEASQAGQGLVIETPHRPLKKDGTWGKPKNERIDPKQIDSLPDPADREILSLLGGARTSDAYGYGSYKFGYSYGTHRYTLTGHLVQALLPRMSATGRAFWRRDRAADELHPVHWDDGEPWQFRLEVRRDGKHYRLAGVLRRGDEKRDLTAPVMLTNDGIILWEDRIARLDDGGAFPWVPLLRKGTELSAPASQGDALLTELLAMPHLPPLDLPEELHFEEVRPTPRPRLKVRSGNKRYGTPRLAGELSFDYEETVVPAQQPGRSVYQSEGRRLLLRDPAAEQAAADRLTQLGFRPPSPYSYVRQPHGLELTARHLPRVVRTLLAENWHVEAEGKLYRNPGVFKMGVESGIDWFELEAQMDFGGGISASLPALLAALKRGENVVQLDDGTFGLLPEAWLKKYGPLASLGTAEDGRLRFSRTQVGLLDALLASQPAADLDAAFRRARDELRNFAGIQPAEPPPGFQGELRGYQCDGLGWLYFLQKFGFGGCLADDMGLGKTVQVLALLESRRELRAGKSNKRPPPSLVVMPRSLVFNWIQEAARFTPQLRVLDHTAIGRAQPGAHFNDYDVVLTTYGTLRRDILALKDFAFDYCILDEAQAVKNAATESAKAVRLIACNHRLALSGTPIENHLGELWSLFEFLNPGMLGKASVLGLGAGTRQVDEETRQLLARALRPFILRRTKLQVAKELPEKSEQTLYCELEPAQRKLYNELRDHYRQALRERIERQGLARSKIHVLEALLRLRQAACHPGLIDKRKTSESSAKLDTLLPQLREVFDEGHKVLVFSQFTSLLAIVRHRLDKDGVPYEYLDGRTRDRGARVERFQTDPACKLFLISLKAGGLGLNLTAAEYVFLLDPWWNPAVEAQAIDRAHRIGQTRPVFAYRLIAKDTVEEKVLELQRTKRDLADAIINADNSLIRSLEREDLELLLS